MHRHLINSVNILILWDVTEYEKYRLWDGFMHRLWNPDNPHLFQNTVPLNSVVTKQTYITGKAVCVCTCHFYNFYWINVSLKLGLPPAQEPHSQDFYSKY